MKTLKNKLFIIGVAISSIVYILQRLKINLPLLINNYLNDILSIPITLFVVLAIIRNIKGENYKLSIPIIFSVVVYYSIYFEYYLPQNNVRYTADYIDILCYCLGGFLFYFIQKFSLLPTTRKVNEIHENPR